ncbi:MAG: hypothetical protein QHH24_01995 [Candidatus Bathyarchaeota archaeon]|jgi:di/tricarboxylate transporter|nr:hypothetical protein [Candidatus Bathyarchaeota archaeon]
MKGVLVFLAVFLATFAASIAYPAMPPGRQIYDALNVPETDYPVLGIPATVLIIAVFNAVIYGIIAWLVFTVAEKARKPKL